MNLSLTATVKEKLTMAYNRKLSVYHDKRADGWRATDALAIARHEIDIWNCPLGGDSDSYEIDGERTVHLTVVPDDWHALKDWLGDCFGETIPVYYHGEAEYQSTEAVRGVGEVYKPTWTYAERRAHYASKGAARGPAHDAAVAGMRAEYDSLLACQSGEVYPCSIYVAVHNVDGTEIGRDCLGGVDSESIISCMLDHDMVGNAISEADAHDAEADAATLAAHSACVGAND